MLYFYITEKGATMQETRFKHYYIEDIGNGEYKVYSNKTGVFKELKQSKVYNTKRVNAKPYIQVGVQGCQLLHRLVADTFVACVDGLTVNHIDGNTCNNSIDNLEVVTQKENHKHAADTGLMPNGEAHRRAKYSDELLLTALKEYKSGASIKTTANKYGISQSYLNKVKNSVYRAYLMESLT